MAEYIRDISTIIEVDTNKRMISRIISADSLTELHELVEHAINDIEKELE